MSEWQIIGRVRDTGQDEEIYEGDDYSNVSDMMHNDGEADARYSRMVLYRNGELDEVANCPPQRGTDWGGWIPLLLLLLVVLFFILAR